MATTAASRPLFAPEFRPQDRREHLLGVRLSEREHQTLKRVAKATGLSLADFTRVALQRAVDAQLGAEIGESDAVTSAE